jgi:hypothetical protein
MDGVNMTSPTQLGLKQQQLMTRLIIPTQMVT